MFISQIYSYILSKFCLKFILTELLIDELALRIGYLLFNNKYVMVNIRHDNNL